LPIIAPNPLVIIINKPWAEERIEGSVALSTYIEPDTLKKSNAIPYTILERIIIHNPLPGSPKENRPKRSTQAVILISITDLIPKRFIKKGMVRIKMVSDICEMDTIIVDDFTTRESAKAGLAPKSLM